MAEQFLSQDEVDALLVGVSGEEPPAEEPPVPQQPQHQARAHAVHRCTATRAAPTWRMNS